MELVISTQTYTEWQWRNPITKEIIIPSPDINPAAHHLFHGDVVDTEGNILNYSPLRTMKNIPCVLDYKHGSHGRTKDNATGKLLYRCIPDDKTLPHLLVPYQAKYIGFEKIKINKYVLVQFKEWSKGEKHPMASLLNTVGNVDDYAAFKEYQLYCKNLVYSLSQFNKNTLFLKMTPRSVEYICKKYPAIQDRTSLHIFSIDPDGCTDIDDAMGIQVRCDYTIISIYIANVPIIMDYSQLWAYFTERCSTIYFPDQKIPMLPSVLSDNICSLLQGEDRFAFAMDIRIPHAPAQAQAPATITFAPVLIKVANNYTYEEADLLNDTDYKLIHSYSSQLNTVTHYLEDILDSHDVVAYFMIAMNHECAKALRHYSCGIFRSAETKENVEYMELPSSVQNFLTNWKYSSGKYCTVDTLSPHKLIGKEGIDVYTHITSPIRRIVDVINMTLLQDKLGLISYDTSTAVDFCHKWLKKIDFINTSVKAIKKVQNSCALLAHYMKVQKIMEREKTIEKENNKVVGYLFDRENDMKTNLSLYKYNVYVPEYNMVTTFKTTEEIENYSSKTFTLHLLVDEANLTRKLRLQMVAC
jgi:exoribonuclease R